MKRMSYHNAGRINQKAPRTPRPSAPAKRKSLTKHVTGSSRILLSWTSALLLSVPLLATGGCVSPGASAAYADIHAAQTGREPNNYAQLLSEYQSGEYRHALASARALLRFGEIPRTRRARVRFIAGLSAYQLGQADAAIRHLVPLVEHPKDEIAGPANATLGLIYQGRDNFKQARRAFQRAAMRLEGSDAARAYFHLGVVEQKLGEWEQADRHLKQAMDLAEDDALKQAIRRRSTITGFTLQAGAYSGRSNARQRVAALRASTRRAGLKPPRIVRLVDSEGDALYHVLVGKFSSRRAAAAAKRRLDRRKVIIVPMGKRERRGG